MMAGAVFIGALLTIVTVWLVNGLVWFARLHYRLLKPALEPQSDTQSEGTSTGGSQ
ncbi:MAG: putative membrane protein [Brevundimonas sp.]